MHTRTPPIFHGRLHPVRTLALPSRIQYSYLSQNNVLIMPDGHAVLNDYDLGGIVVGDPPEGDPPSAELRRYLSPEQLTGSSEPNTSSDIWSFGCIFLKVSSFREGRIGDSDVRRRSSRDAYPTKTPTTRTLSRKYVKELCLHPSTISSALLASKIYSVSAGNGNQDQGRQLVRSPPFYRVDGANLEKLGQFP